MSAIASLPGRSFDGEGAALDGLRGNLTQERIDACEFRGIVVLRDLAPVARVWLLDDHATFRHPAGYSRRRRPVG